MRLRLAAASLACALLAGSGVAIAAALGGASRATADPATLIDAASAELKQTTVTYQLWLKYSSTNTSTHWWKAFNDLALAKQALPAASSTTATTAAPPPPTASADPSGVPAPVGDISGWHQIYVDNFANENVPLGASCGDPNGFPHVLSTRWYAYPYPWNGTPTWGTYCPERTTSIANGVLDQWIHSEQIGGVWKHLIDAVGPVIPGYPASNGQLHGRYVIRFREPVSFPQYHISWLLWPTSEVWPRDGELDWPEADTNSNGISGFMHWQGGTSGGSQSSCFTATPIYGSAWHTAMIEWLASRVTYSLDGQVCGNFTDTSKIPNTPMRWVIQTGGSFGTTTPDNASQGHIDIDWVAIYAPA